MRRGRRKSDRGEEDEERRGRRRSMRGEEEQPRSISRLGSLPLAGSNSALSSVLHIHVSPVHPESTIDLPPLSQSISLAYIFYHHQHILKLILPYAIHINNEMTFESKTNFSRTQI